MNLQAQTVYLPVELKQCRNTYVEADYHNIQVTFGDKNEHVCNVFTIEAIVLTPAQYKEDMIDFLKWREDKFVRFGDVYIKKDINHEPQISLTPSELFDIYTTTKEKV